MASVGKRKAPQPDEKGKSEDDKKGSSASAMEVLRKELIQFFQAPSMIQKIMVNHINNRVQEFPDPITSTLILMVSSPIQVVFCEEGVLLFKTSNLPVLPYNVLSDAEKRFLRDKLSGLDNALLHETYHGCGKFSVQINVGGGIYMPKTCLLLAFVDVMSKQKGFKEKSILQRLSDIIIQRFLSNISVHSDDITVVMEKIWGSSERHLLL